MRILAAIVIILFVIGSVVYLAKKSNDCTEKGGVLMKNAWGHYQCVKPIGDN